MRFESFVLVRLLRPPGSVTLPPEQAAAVQDAHLAHIHAMHAVNPACAKCRIALDSFDAAGAEYTVRRYLEPPSSAAPPKHCPRSCP